jgi:hypothetical protein
VQFSATGGTPPYTINGPFTPFGIYVPFGMYYNWTDSVMNGIPSLPARAIGVLMEAEDYFGCSARQIFVIEVGT